MTAKLLLFGSALDTASTTIEAKSIYTIGLLLEFIWGFFNYSRSCCSKAVVELSLFSFPTLRGMDKGD